MKTTSARSFERQAGVALVTALLVVAIATVAAVAMAAHLQLDLRRTSNLIQGDQALLYVLGLEGWAGQILSRDRTMGPVDTLADVWNKKLPPITVEGGQITGSVIDLQGRFNLNGLVTADGKHDATALARFKRLLAALELETGIAEAVVDWIDPDGEATGSGGAEDNAYLGLTPAYRAANRLMASVTELRLVAGVTPEAYAKLAPNVSALPEPAAINVNTAPAPVLQCLIEGMTAADATALAEERGEQGYDTIEKFLNVERVKGRVSGERLTVGSNYFMVTSAALIGRVQLSWNHLFVRDDKGEVKVLQRSQATE